jgi:glycosyltransferase involved in cell wall biosynthesis
MRAPLVTIVVPVYNQADYLEACLRSVIAQTFDNWELIAVDDGSTRGDPGAIVSRIDDPRIRFVAHDGNRGLAAARNTGIRAGTGDYLLPLDCDDMLAPEYLAATVAATGRPAAFDVVITDFDAFGVRRGRLVHPVRDLAALLQEQWIPGPGTLFHRRVWEAAGGYCEHETIRFGNEDWEFWISAAAHHVRVTRVPRPRYRYRQHVESMVHRQQLHEHITREFICRRHQALFARYPASRKVFLSGGYLAGAKAHWRRGQPVAACRLGLRALLTDPGHCLSTMWTMAARRYGARSAPRPAAGTA